MHLSTLTHSDVYIAALNGGRDQGEAKGDGEPRKSVTIAPRSHYLTDRRYVERKPLFTEEHHASILKMSHRHPPKLPEKVTDQCLFLHRTSASLNYELFKAE